MCPIVIGGQFVGAKDRNLLLEALTVKENVVTFAEKCFLVTSAHIYPPVQCKVGLLVACGDP